MAKRPTYKQLKAKKNWLLHTSSNQRKFKSKCRLTTSKSRRRAPSVGNEHINISRKRTIFQHLTHIKKFFTFANGIEGYEETGFGLNVPLLPLKMLLLAIFNGTISINQYFQEMMKNFGILSESLNRGIIDGFKRVNFYQQVCENSKICLNVGKVAFSFKGQTKAQNNLHIFYSI